MTAWILTGATASGKSSLAIELADRFDLEILSMDSMAIYRRMNIGTAKPSSQDRKKVPHHLIDIVDPCDSFDTNRWCVAAQKAMEDIHARGRHALFVGGTPLYMMAFFKGMMETPPAQPELRASLQKREEEDPGSLHRELALKDPQAAERIHHRDIKRLVRALEVFEMTGETISAQQAQFDSPNWRVPCRIAAIKRPREELKERVKERTIEMLDEGLIDEVREIRDSCGFSRESAAAIGYAQCLAHLDGRYKDLEELRNQIRRSTHRLIRRQLTWLRRLPEIDWISPEQGIDRLIAALAG